MATSTSQPLTPAGLAADGLTPKQRELLMALIDVYTGYMAAGPRRGATGALEAGRHREDRRSRGLGPTHERGEKHYYRIQGPTFLVEYDNTQNDGNHIHSVWRDFQGDFGRDLLREHIRADH